MNEKRNSVLSSLFIHTHTRTPKTKNILMRRALICSKNVPRTVTPIIPLYSGTTFYLREIKMYHDGQIVVIVFNNFE